METARIPARQIFVAAGAERLLPNEVAWRRKAMFRAPLAESFLSNPPPFVRDLISGEALARTGYFDAAAVERDCGLLRNGKAAKLTFTKLGLGGVVATQLWHHLYLGGGLCDLPDLWHTPAGGATIGHVRRGVINASH
jgi:asparagine synthase (glutamine-hydrolysing)